MEHTTVEVVGGWLGLTEPTSEDTVHLTMCVAAVNAFVTELPHVEDITELTKAGATMLAARLYRRRNSPAGITAFGTDGGAVYVQRQDPDVALLLGLGAYARPRVG